MKSILASFSLLLAGAISSQATTILLDDFNSGSATGTVLDGTTWVGQVVQNPDSISVTGSALDDNGWGATFAPMDLSGTNVLAITARVDDGNESPLLSVMFLDMNLNAEVFTVSTSQFLAGGFSTVLFSITSWGAVDPTQITDWNLGGGSLGLSGFRMSFDELSLQYVPPTNAVPERGAVAMLLFPALVTCLCLRSRRVMASDS